METYKEEEEMLANINLLYKDGEEEISVCQRRLNWTNVEDEETL